MITTRNTVALTLLVALFILPLSVVAGAPYSQVKVICNDEHIIDTLGFESVNGSIYVWSTQYTTYEDADGKNRAFNYRNENGTVGQILDSQMEELVADCGEFSSDGINKRISKWINKHEAWYNNNSLSDFVIVLKVGEFKNTNELERHSLQNWNAYYNDPDSIWTGTLRILTMIVGVVFTKITN